jgi:ubiquinone/menaquinone biosynthesis C-methylase UbiE
VILARDLADAVNGVPERFVRDQMQGQLIEAEHLSRYWWASDIVRGKRVLDAGCGTGYGCLIFAEAGAREVVGVDVASDVLDAVAGTMPDSVHLEEGDVRQLPFGDASFAAVSCFEVLEHIEDPELALDEFVRVLSDDGVLVVSSPNRAVYPRGNPHHVHEFLPEELRATLATRFAHVQLFRQQNWITSAVFGDADFVSDSEERIEPVAVRKLAGAEPGAEVYTLALASNEGLTGLPAQAVLTRAVDLRDLVTELERHRRNVAALEQEIERRRQDAATLEELSERQRNELEREVKELEAELDELRPLRVAFEDQVAHLAFLQERLEGMSQRQAELRRTVLDAHAQLLQRDEEFRSRYEAEMRPKEEEIAWLREVVTNLEAMRTTRVWRVGERYWRFKERLRRVLRLGRA